MLPETHTHLLFPLDTLFPLALSRTVWPSGLRRVTRNHFSSGGVGSNPAAVVFLFDDTDHDYPRLSHDLFEASLAQSVERAALNRTVVGSSPTGSVFYFSTGPTFLFYYETLFGHFIIVASLAQSVERAAFNRTVVGSSPTGSAFFLP